MLKFVELLKQEQPAIQHALERAVDRLPLSVREVSAYVLLAGGKRLRPTLTLTTGRLFGCERPDLYDLAAVPEMIHVASLLHDDVLDGADARRGKKSAHLVYGISPCLLSGDALLASASLHVSSYGDPAMVNTVSEAMMRTVAGEAHEIALQGSLTHGMDAYIDIVAEKTGWLLRAACRLGAQFAGASAAEVDAVSEFGLNLGIAFQMVDDALDFADETVTGKPTGGDLREGKLTPPVMLLRDALPNAGPGTESSSPFGGERADFDRKFSQGLFTDAEVADFSQRIRDLGLDRRTRELADGYLHKAEVCLNALPERPEREIFRQVLAFVRDREV